jgi:hypothetical protein
MKLFIYASITSKTGIVKAIVINGSYYVMNATLYVMNATKSANSSANSVFF